MEEQKKNDEQKQGIPGNKKAFWLFFAFVGLSVILYTYIYEPSPKVNSSTKQDYNIPDMSKVLVTTSLEKRGAFLFITTQVKNNSNELLKRDLEIYVLDNDGNKYLANAAQFNLQAGQKGTLESKKRLIQINGPAPYTVLTEWR